MGIGRAGRPQRGLTVSTGGLVRVLAGPERRTSTAAPCGYSGILQADAYGGYNALYEDGRITEAACMAHARRKSTTCMPGHRPTSQTEALKRIGKLHAIEAEIRGSPADERLAVRKEQTIPLMQSLYDWIQVQMKVPSRHSDTAKAFAYLLKQWDALNLYCSNGWAEIDNNIAENALRGVALAGKLAVRRFRYRRRTCGDPLLSDRHLPA